MDKLDKGVFKVEMPGRSKRGRPQRRSMDVVKEDMQGGDVTEVEGLLCWLLKKLKRSCKMSNNRSFCENICRICARSVVPVG